MSVLLRSAEQIGQEVLELLQPWTDGATLAGSIRRRKPYVKDIEIVAMPSEIHDDLFGVARFSTSEIQEIAANWGRVTKNGARYIQVRDVLGCGVTLDLFLVRPPAEWGTILAIRTGPAAYSQEAVTKIRGRLWKCEAGGVYNDKNLRVPTPTEEDFFQAARMPFLPPWERGV